MPDSHKETIEQETYNGSFFIGTKTKKERTQKMKEIEKALMR